MAGVLGGMFAMLAKILCAPLHAAGLGWLYFAMMGLIAVLLGAFGSVFTTYSTLYLAKDNDLLLSLPIPVSVLDKSDGKDVIRGLKSAGGYLRRELGRALSLRYTPELVFQEDTSIDKGTHILKLLNDIEHKESGGQV